MSILMMATVWYIPGWLRAESPQEGCLERLTNTYEACSVEFKPWNGNIPIWPKAVANADETSERLADEVAALPEEVRTNLTIVGHSLGGRITARVLARLNERNVKIRQGVTLAAAIPHDDPDIAKMGGGSMLPVISICNPDDVVLRYIYTVAGGERNAAYGSPAYGANGSLAKLDNVIECVTPTNLTETVKIDHLWGESERLKKIANHHVHFYLDYLRRTVEGEGPSDRVMVVQDFITVKGRVIDAGIWWKVLDTAAGWKLEKNIVTGHCRILDPNKIRHAWGGENRLRASFDKIKSQLQPEK